MPKPQTLINPIFVDADGHNQTGVASLSIDEMQQRVFVLTFTPPPSFGFASFDLSGNLKGSTLAYYDGIHESGWTGSNSPLGIAPGGSKLIWCGGPNGGSFIVYDRNTMTYIQNCTPGIGTFYNARHYMSVSPNEKWACTIAPQTGTLGAILYDVVHNVILADVDGLSLTDAVLCTAFDSHNNLFLGTTAGYVKAYSLYFNGVSIVATLIGSYQPRPGGPALTAIPYIPQFDLFSLWYADGHAYLWQSWIGLSQQLTGLPTSIGAIFNDKDFWHFKYNNQFLCEGPANNFIVADFFRKQVTAVPRSLWTGAGTSNTTPLYDAIGRNIWAGANGGGICLLPFDLPPSPPSPPFVTAPPVYPLIPLGGKMAKPYPYSFPRKAQDDD